MEMMRSPYSSSASSDSFIFFIFVRKYVPALTWPSPFVNNPGILAGQVRYISS